MPTVRLDQQDQVGLILIHPTGVAYETQTGGVLCHHPQQEGAYIPLARDAQVVVRRAVDEIRTDLGLPRSVLVSSGLEGDPGMPEDAARRLDTALRLAGINAIVDRDRLDESHESWVYLSIVVPGTGRWEMADLAGFSAILTWRNSD